MAQNEWISDAKSSGWWNSLIDLQHYREDCQHDLDHELQGKYQCEDIVIGLKVAIAELTTRIGELTPEPTYTLADYLEDMEDEYPPEQTDK